MKMSAWSLAIAALALFGCATAPTRPPSVDVTGNWTGEVAVPRRVAAPVTMTLRQTGARVTGEVRAIGFPLASGPVTGWVDGDVFSFSYENVTGGAKLTVRSDEMAGTTDAGNRMVVRRHSR
ncbi:MAG: hypothetical protein HYR51_19585 [Candidatus Rokubacteria bacterium]|nr:hypothetical protein [Candidatus Rokubacteria bacterium]